MWTEYLNVLHKEILPAVGCTEPAAVALACATAAHFLPNHPEYIKVEVSRNIFKNGLGVGIPGTKQHGLGIAAALGVCGGNYTAGLEVLAALSDEVVAAAEEMVARKRVVISLAGEGTGDIYVRALVSAGGEEAVVVIEEEHSRITEITVNGTVRKVHSSLPVHKERSSFFQDLNLRAIVRFATEVSFDEIKFLLDAAVMNEAIALDGISCGYGLHVGQAFKEKSVFGNSTEHLPPILKAALLSAGASDARMNGSSLPVMSNSGSGNQGITATVPIVVFAKELKTNDERLARALALSHLVAIYIKHFADRLSAFCGAVTAAAGAACGISFLMGGSYEEIAMTLQNSLSGVTGMICDGAKSSCALKIATAVQSTLLSSSLALQHYTIAGGEGIVDPCVDTTIRNIGTLTKQGMRSTDSTILEIMRSQGR